LNNNGDIIIDSIELVQKPLPKLTINGIDGFTSGKWALHANAQVVDDSTLVLNATGTGQNSTLVIPVLPNTTYSFTQQGTGTTLIQELDSNKNAISFNANRPFTTSNNTYYVMFYWRGDTTGQFTFKCPMLNLGVIPAPYSRKTGDKMVLPTFKNNLFDKSFTIGAGDATYGTQQTAVAVGVLSNFISVKPNTVYKVYMFNNTGTPLYYGVNPYAYDTNKNFFGNNTTGRPTFSNLSGDGSVGTTSGYQFTTSANTYFVRLQVNRGTGSFSFAECQSLNSTLQLEEGVNNTPYAVQLNKKPQRKTTAKTGLAFNGVTDYLQLPSMTMDSIEIECLIDAVQPQSGGNLFDARSGLANGWVGNSPGNYGSGIKSITGLVTNVRTKVLITAISSFTDDVVIFCDLAGSLNKRTKGIIYKVTCYLNGGVVAKYDFENPRNTVGNQVIPNAQNLIPSFEDARWSIHANAKVMGKDVLHLDATGTYQGTTIYVPVNVGEKYLIGGNITVGGEILVAFRDNNKNSYGATSPSSVTSSNPTQSFTVPSGCSFLQIYVRNTTQTIGSFDFVRPQLYQLTGQEGTVNGAPILQFKHAKRRLYNKR
jgi:hypothetical protein